MKSNTQLSMMKRWYFGIIWSEGAGLASLSFLQMAVHSYSSVAKATGQQSISSSKPRSTTTTTVSIEYRSKFIWKNTKNFRTANAKQRRQKCWAEKNRRLSNRTWSFRANWFALRASLECRTTATWWWFRILATIK